MGLGPRASGLGLIAILGCNRDPPPPPAPAPAPPVVVAPKRPAQLQHVTIKALGMYCEESCPMRVRYALANIPAVYELGFDLSHEAIFVSYDATLGPPKQVTKPMIAAIKMAGFDPWLAKEEWPADATAQVIDHSELRK